MVPLKNRCKESWASLLVNILLSAFTGVANDHVSKNWSQADRTHDSGEGPDLTEPPASEAVRALQASNSRRSESGRPSRRASASPWRKYLRINILRWKRPPPSRPPPKAGPAQAAVDSAAAARECARFPGLFLISTPRCVAQLTPKSCIHLWEEPERFSASVVRGHCQVDEVSAVVSLGAGRPRAVSRRTSPHPRCRRSGFASDGSGQRGADVGPRERDSGRHHTPRETVARGRQI